MLLRSTGLALLAFSFASSQAVADSATAGPADTSILSPQLPAHKEPENVGPNSIYFFGGRLSITPLDSTLMFNLDRSSSEMTYDNYIAGIALARDLYKIGLGFTLGGEIGGAMRFGPYALCCHPVVKSSGLVSSPELWVGPRISHEGFVLFGKIRLAGAVTWGVSFAGNSIGHERVREIDLGGSARALFYLGPEIILSMTDFPNLEFVYREHHRSGANGTLGKLREGYNANVFGVRYKF